MPDVWNNTSYSRDFNSWNGQKQYSNGWNATVTIADNYFNPLAPNPEKRDFFGINLYRNGHVYTYQKDLKRDMTFPPGSAETLLALFESQVDEKLSDGELTDEEKKELTEFMNKQVDEASQGGGGSSGKHNNPTQTPGGPSDPSTPDPFEIVTVPVEPDPEAD